MQETHVPAAEGSVAVGAQTSRWTAGRVTALAIGSLLVLLSLGLLGAGGTGLWADRTQRDDGYATTDVHHYSTAGSALATESTELGAAGFGWLYSPGLLGKVRVRVTPASPGSVFVGIGPSAEVDRYLAGVGHTVISDFWSDDVETVRGGAPGSPPGRQDFWVASKSGSGKQSLVWEPADGDWTVVVMNADGRAGIDIGADLGAKAPTLLWIAIGLLLGGAIFLGGGGLLIASAVRGSTSEGGGVMSATVAATASQAVSGLEEDVRYEGIKQYSVAQILGVWAAAALPMAALSWIVAPILDDHLSGPGDVPMIKAMLLLLTAGMVWQFVLVAVLLWREQRTFRWPVVRNALWLLSPRSPKTGRTGGRLWWVVLPFCLLFAVEAVLPVVGAPENRDFGSFLDSDIGQRFLSGAWGWFGVIILMQIFNTLLGEELLFRGLLLPRMKRAFGRGDWAANGTLFAAYHIHSPWLIPWTLLVDTFAIAYPSRRYQSAWIGIVVHSTQSVFFLVIVLRYVM